MLVRIFRVGRDDDKFEVQDLSEAIAHLRPGVPVDVHYNHSSLACCVRIVRDEEGYKLVSSRGVIPEEDVHSISQGENWKARE